MAKIPENKPADAQRQHTSGNPNGIRRSINAVQLHARRLRAVELRVAGWTYDEIAAELGIGHQTARLDVGHILSQIETEKVPALREIEAARLDIVVWNALQVIRDHPGTEISLKASDKVMQAIRSRASLFGLNAPVEVTLIERTEVDNEIAKLIAQVEEANAKTRAKIIEGTAEEAGLPALDVT